MAIEKKSRAATAELVSWIGGNDLKSLQGGGADGPLLSTLKAQPFSKLYALYNYPAKDVEPYLAKIKKELDIEIDARFVALSSPIHFGDIYQASSTVLDAASNKNKHINILLSPGTPAMQAVWILLGKTRYQALFWQSSIEQGVEQVEIPFNISAEFLPSLSKQLAELTQSPAPQLAAFDDIITQNPRMLKLKEQAARLAIHDVPVLIQGESGTGKELFARAIHNTSRRAAKPFIAVNCGAIPEELIDAELFGFVKGAFTGAIKDKIGYFEAAHEGTIFLDEFGELSKSAQVRLLRVLQDGTFSRVGDARPVQVDVRLIAATNRDLVQEVANGNFREDLFYRVAIGVLQLPPLREREGDIGLLLETMLKTIAAGLGADSEASGKKISVKGKNIMLKHTWPGNVRELHATLLRAALWSDSATLTESDIHRAMLKFSRPEQGMALREIGKNFNIQDVISDIARHYLLDAMQQTGGNKTRAAELLGLGSYQTLNNWLDKYQL